MRLEHQFTVPVPLDEAWKVLLDVPRVTPCMPGAALENFDGETFRGSVKVKLGPMTLQYKGQGRLAETDESARRVVMEASGKESRGSGTAAATVTATMTPDGGETRVDMTTELRITGRPAQFGRGMINDVAGRLIGQFADCLATTLGAGTPAGAEPAGVAAGAQAAKPAESATGRDRRADEKRESVLDAEAERADVEVEPIDLLEITGAQAALRRYGPYVAGIAALFVVLWILVRRRR